MRELLISNAAEHNLKSVNLAVPKYALVVFTGVSGSGKSSLAFDTIYREGQRRYLSSLSAYARHFIGKLGRPAAEQLEGISPTLSLSQQRVSANPRSTVGTMSTLGDHLRLLFSRLGDADKPLDAAQFSFNSPRGACEACRGLGVVDRLNPALLVSDEDKTLRQGALVITTPSGYIIYSQVTMAVLDQVCRAHGFSVDVPWRQLTEAQRHVVLHGSDRLRIPFGKHPLESRLKWSGITAQPREEGYYKGIIPVMEQILKRDRNKNILRFVESAPCGECKGTRLNELARSVRLADTTITELNRLAIGELEEFFSSIAFQPKMAPIAAPIVDAMVKRAATLDRLGVGYLTLDRASTTLSGGEAQRIRLANQLNGALTGVLFVLDEPAGGLHPHDREQLHRVLQQLRDNGNTVFVVEHDESTMLAADWLVDLGPGPGRLGGEILYSGPPRSITDPAVAPNSATGACLSGIQEIPLPLERRRGSGQLKIHGARQFNLRNITTAFKLGAFNAVTGVSGAGKSTLVMGILARALAGLQGQTAPPPGTYDRLSGADAIHKVIEITQSPIGRTPRSNPATYTKLFDRIRGLFAALPEAQTLGFNKSRFSFNVKGGRCEACHGAGVQQVSMHFLDDVSVVCDSCGGARFNDETLQVKLRGQSIYDVLKMTVETAAAFFAGHRQLTRELGALLDVGLGYLTLGQPSTTLSGGEAQRVKLAAQLGRPATGHTLYILDEPTLGLHTWDVRQLLEILHRLVDEGHTVIVIAHHLDVIKAADWVVDLGPGSGERGGQLVGQGTPEQIAAIPASLTGNALGARLNRRLPIEGNEPCAPSFVGTAPAGQIELQQVSTHNLKEIDVAIPRNRLTVITGVSGSGKSSLAFDTIYAEGRRRFMESLSTHARRYLKQLPAPPAQQFVGLGPTIAVGQERGAVNPRSTVGTITEIYDFYRLLYSRAGRDPCGARHPARMFSFNHHLGSCERCNGLGVVAGCDPRKLVTHPERSLFDGALRGHKIGRFFSEPGGRYLAILSTVGEALGIDFDRPYAELSATDRRIAMRGNGDRIYPVNWQYNRKGRRGNHNWETPWAGFAGYVDERYARVHDDKRGDDIRPVLSDHPCEACQGERLGPAARAVTVAGRSIGALSAMPVDQAIDFFSTVPAELESATTEQAAAIWGLQPEIVRRLSRIADVGLGYLSIDRRFSTLSSGEAQRLLLATQLGSPLSDVIYILDEPTMGLHPLDVNRLIDSLHTLRDAGNTVIVVEHDAQVIRRADHVIDLGPGAGAQGGEIVFAGPVSAMIESTTSLTGKCLAGRSGPTDHESTQTRRRLEKGIRVRGAVAHNLRSIDVAFPLGGLAAVTGASGSGKSTLLFDVLKPSMERGEAIGCGTIDWEGNAPAVVEIDASPIGATPASTVATYSGLFDPIRDLFAGTEEAKARGYKKSRFSTRGKEGRCDRCRGVGQIKTEMGFLAEVWIECDGCGGRRFNDQTLEVTYRGRSIAEILSFDIERAREFFVEQPKLADRLQVLSRLGLGYLKLGQSAPSLSGGEAQRLKLAAELLRVNGRAHARQAGPRLYLFDEPTIGLHFADVEKLLTILDELIAAGNTVLMIEHNLQVIRRADWIIDLGPGGGDHGGRLVATGTPEDITSYSNSPTGRALLDIE